MSDPADSGVTRGKVVGSKIGPRTLIQITGLDGVSQNTVELLLPHGFSANPARGSDVVLFEVLGSSDHVVALGSDMAGNAIADLAPGEFGLSDGANKIIVRGTFVQIISPLKVRVEAPRLECTGEIVARCDGAFVQLSAHTHDHGDPPDPNT